MSDGRSALSGVELRQYMSYVGGQFREWENSYYQYERGLFTEEEFEARRRFWRLRLAGERGEFFREAWANAGNNFAPSFRAEIDAIVAEVGG